MISPSRRQIIVRGIVQGVGFRPFIYGLALQVGLAGFVQNDSDGVLIEVEGPPDALARFVERVRSDAPPLSQIDSLEVKEVAPRGNTSFSIIHSAAGAVRNTLISPDTAVCADCLRELLDPADRRYRYPFINCTNCGPRFTIVADVPYDRAQTTMRVFPMCPSCQAEYDDPLNRRFHAQPNACPVCGPQVALLRAGEPHAPLAVEDAAIRACAAALAAGQIVAVKGLGGYHLACHALDAAAVARLRARKHREAKPLALMVCDLAAARAICHVGTAEAALLVAPRRPIVLLERRADAPFEIPAELAPGQRTLGLMLPYTPLHHLLLDTFGELLPPGQPAALVMTSGNLSDEPIAYRDEDAHARLGGIADLVLSHNREILTRCDDSVTRVAAGGEQIIRRSRGAAPAPIALDMEFPRHILACGAHLKNTFCMAKGHQAFLSHHIGDLENLETLESFHEGIAHMGRLFDIQPEVVAYDLHPEYLATKAALAMPIAQKIGVQHHHAHIASVIAEHGLRGPLIGVAADGTGYGEDGTIWGGEILVADLADYTRAGHLATVPLPGGDQAVRQPWRVAAAYLEQCYGPAFLDRPLPFAQQIDRARWAVMRQMIARGLNCPLTSSMGRLFDAVAAIVGLRGVVQYEGQAAIELEACAVHGLPAYSYAIGGAAGQPFQIDLRPTVLAIVDDIEAGASVGHVAGRFQSTMSNCLAAACRRVRDATGLGTVALSGGVFQNRMLLENLSDLLSADGFLVYTNRRVPPNDGGISLGQAAIAAARITRRA